jgi:hypothetical protein
MPVSKDQQRDSDRNFPNSNFPNQLTGGTNAAVNETANKGCRSH